MKEEPYYTKPQIECPQIPRLSMHYPPIWFFSHRHNSRLSNTDYNMRIRLAPEGLKLPLASRSFGCTRRISSWQLKGSGCWPSTLIFTSWAAEIHGMSIDGWDMGPMRMEGLILRANASNTFSTNQRAGSFTSGLMNSWPVAQWSKGMAVLNFPCKFSDAISLHRISMWKGSMKVNLHLNSYSYSM